ncbi:MAG: ion transporter [Deltaproteobacteria bacterium]|nr:ion transporter [Deltaproteobacteria bacterium]MBW2019897.1 ion transporter [Deltaproteobacteria bacterium]MBW2074953.1 ion transporter [Deltaproteobacteria bacterium]
MSPQREKQSKQQKRDTNNKDHLATLTRLWKRFLRSRTWPVILAIILIFSLTSAGVLLFEHDINEGFHNFGDVVWWAIVTASTVGYGDKVPETTGGRVIGILVILFGVGLASIVTGRIASWLVEWKIKEGSGLATQKKLKKHLVICGWKNEMPSLLLHIVKVNPGLASEDIVLVSMVKPAMVENLRSIPELQNINFVRGDYVDEAVLHRANIKRAARALVLADSSIEGSPQEVDSRTVMTVMTIKSISKNIYTCVELIDSKFERYLRGVHCDEIFPARYHNRILLANASAASGVTHIIRDLLDMEQNRLVTKAFPARFVGDTFASLSHYFMESEKSILIGVLENTGNIYKRKKEALRMAQRTPDLSRLVTNLQEVKKLQGNQPVFNPGPDYEIKPYSRAILIQQ